MIKKGIEAEAALESMLTTVDLGIDLDQRFAERPLGFDFFGTLSRFLKAK